MVPLGTPASVPRAGAGATPGPTSERRGPKATGQGPQGCQEGAEEAWQGGTCRNQKDGRGGEGKIEDISGTVLYRSDRKNKETIGYSYEHPNDYYISGQSLMRGILKNYPTVIVSGRVVGLFAVAHLAIVVVADGVDHMLHLHPRVGFVDATVNSSDRTPIRRYPGLPNISYPEQADHDLSICRSSVDNLVHHLPL